MPAGGPGPLFVYIKIIVNFCWTRAMLKETEEKVDFVLIFLSLTAC